jgi:hypothetical protein
MEQRTQACSWMHGVPKARAQVPMETLRFSKWPRNSFHSSSVGGAVFLAGPRRAAAGEECQVGLDGLVRVDGFVAHGDVDVAVPADDLGDVRREPVHDHVGDEDAPEVMRGEPQRLALRAGQAGGGDRAGQQLADVRAGDETVLGAVAGLEQQGQRRVPDPLVLVVGGDERDRAAGPADSRDDGGQDVGQLRADQQEPFGVGLGRGDLQERDQLAGGREPVLDEAVVGQFGEFLDAYPGVP